MDIHPPGDRISSLLNSMDVILMILNFTEMCLALSIRLLFLPSLKSTHCTTCTHITPTIQLMIASGFQYLCYKVGLILEIYTTTSPIDASILGELSECLILASLCINTSIPITTRAICQLLGMACPCIQSKDLLTFQVFSSTSLSLGILSFIRL